MARQRKKEEDEKKKKNKSLKIADAANDIKGVKLIRGVPKHVYNLDRKRYEEEYRKIKGIRKA